MTSKELSAATTAEEGAQGDTEPRPGGDNWVQRAFVHCWRRMANQNNLALKFQVS